MRRAWPGLLVILALAGCATPREPLRQHLASQLPALRSCAEWFAALDAEVASAGVGDAQEARVAGFPYLRVSRFLGALAAQGAPDEAALRSLAGRMATLDHSARRAELANLPRDRLAALPALVPGASPGEALARPRECGRLLREVDLAEPAARRALLERARVPDDYSALARALGLYPLTRLVFSAGVRRWEAEAREAFAREDSVADGRLRLLYAPPPAQAAGKAVKEDLAPLVAAHAPSFEIETAADYDRFGALGWARGEAVPVVDLSAPVAYVHAAHTLYRGRALLQLVYTIWFPERPPREPGDIYAGRLDGLTWRVTLAPDGEPLVYDAMHPCGCFHMFFPTARATPLPAPEGTEEWAFVPQRLARVSPGERPRVRLASGTHYVEGVALVRGAEGVARYDFRAYDELRSMARPEGGRASVFGPDGLVAGTERLERFLFWPMGIASAGAVRQWGRHATAFVGRRHFDDADLFDKRFMFDLE